MCCSSRSTKFKSLICSSKWDSAPVMSILSRNVIHNPSFLVNRNIPIIKSPNFCRISKANHPPKLRNILVYQQCRDAVSMGSLLGSHRWRIRVSETNAVVAEGNEGLIQFNFLDYFLSLSELTILVSSLVVSIACVVYLKQKNLGLAALGNRVLVWLLGGAVVVGAAIRRRQWRRICCVRVSESGVAPDNVNVIERIEKLEESLKSATTIIRVLSRQLEKLGIRFRVTRKALKHPIAETLALAQKNSETTLALAAQEDRLEKELGEVQKVLLAMQDQQQKQLELILAIAKNGKLLGPDRETSQGSDAHE